MKEPITIESVIPTCILEEIRYLHKKLDLSQEEIINMALVAGLSELRQWSEKDD